MQKIGGAVSQARKQMEERMAGLSEEQKAMMAKMMDQYMPGGKPKKTPVFEIRDTGRKETVGDYNCRLWEATVEGQVRWQHCVVDFGRIAGSQEMFDALGALMTMMKDFATASDSTWLLDQGMSAGWEGLEKIDGYPVLTRTFKDGKPDTESVLHSARSVALNAANFEPPVGYKRKEMPMQ
jgi:hypothetical protein